jgi:alkyl hydroperoxide reductase subunit AhpF
VGVTILRPEEEARVRELFAALERPVELLVALGPGEAPPAGARDLDFGAETTRVAEGLAALSANVSARVVDQPPGFPRFPSISIRPDGEDVGLRYDGLPWGYELGSLIGGILEAGRREPTLRPESREALAALDRDLALEVFVTPT